MSVSWLSADTIESPGFDRHLVSINELIERREFDKARKEIERFVVLHKSDPQTSFYEEFYKGTISMEIRGYSNALDWFNKAEASAHRISNSDLLFRVLNRKGDLFLKSGNNMLSLQVFRECLAMAERRNDPLGMALAQNYIGTIYFKVGQFPEAITYFDGATKLFTRLATEDQTKGYWVENGLDNIALCYDRMGDTAKAELYYLRAIEACNKSDNIIGASVAQVNLGKLLTYSGQYNRAYNILLHSVKNASTVDYEHYDHASQANFELARVLIRLNRLVEAEKYLDDGFVFMQRRDLEFVRDFYLLRSELLEAQGRFQESYKTIKSYLHISDSIRKQEAPNLYLREGLNLEFQRKESENRLRIKNEEINSLKDREMRYYYIFISCLLLFLIGAVVYYRRYGLRLKALNSRIQDHRFSLEHANNSLHKANSQKDMIMATVAHDLRSLIGGLLVGTRTLKRSASQQIPAGTDTRDLLNLMDQTSNHALQIVQDLVDAKELEDKSVKIVSKPVVLARLVSDAWDSLKYLAIPKSVQLVATMDENVVVYVDAVRFSRVLENLISNAIKFSKTGGQIWVRAAVHRDSTEVCVEDNGIGIPESAKDQIFEPFFKAARGTNGEKSSGLGLSIVKQIIELHHGQVWVESEAGKGTRFYIRLPNGSA